MTPQERRQEKIAKIIEDEISYLNGWWVPYKTMQENCREASRKILRYLNLHSRRRKKAKP